MGGTGIVLVHSLAIFICVYVGFNYLRSTLILKFLQLKTSLRKGATSGHGYKPLIFGSAFVEKGSTCIQLNTVVFCAWHIHFLFSHLARCHCIYTSEAHFGISLGILARLKDILLLWTCSVAIHVILQNSNDLFMGLQGQDSLRRPHLWTPAKHYGGSQATLFLHPASTPAVPHRCSKPFCFFLLWAAIGRP